MSGAWVSRARLAAALGKPMPTKQTVPLASWRAAATVIISSAVKPSSAMRGHLGLAIELRAVEHVALHPGGERVALARDGVPGLVEAAVAAIVVMDVGRSRATRSVADRVHHPPRQHAAIDRRTEPVDDLLDGDDGAL